MDPSNVAIKLVVLKTSYPGADLLKILMEKPGEPSVAHTPQQQQAHNPYETLDLQLQLQGQQATSAKNWGQP